MANVFLAEHEDWSDKAVLRAPATTVQNVLISTTAQSSGSFAVSTRVIRVHAETSCFVRFATAPSATITDTRLATGQTEYFAVPSSSNTTLKISVISA